MFIAVDFYLPSFVLAGVGVVLLLAATLIGYGTTGSVNATILLFCAEAALGFGAGYLSIKYFPRTPTGRRMILASTQTGLRAQSSRATDWVGREGVAQTILRPAGVALIDGQRTRCRRRIGHDRKRQPDQNYRRERKSTRGKETQLKEAQTWTLAQLF
jgi:membrane-bound ClpP family serine protease